MSIVVVDLSVRRKEETVLGNTEQFDLSISDKVIVEVEQALEVGKVISQERLIEKPKNPAYRIIRKLTQEDCERLKENVQKNTQASKMILQKVENYELKMKLTCAEYTFDRTKLFIYYTSETRIDFRELIKDLGHLLKTRVQMVQIGVRDEAKMLGGIGTCGRQLCCHTFLKNFAPVTVDMAKHQDVSLNIAKLSGLCGRLMCCLAYEHCFYAEAIKKSPKINSKVHTPKGTGTIVSINYIKEEITVELQDKQIHKFSAKEISSSFLDRIRFK